MGFWIPIGLIEYLRNIVHCHSRNLIHNWYPLYSKTQGEFQSVQTILYFRVVNRPLPFSVECSCRNPRQCSTSELSLLLSRWLELFFQVLPYLSGRTTMGNSAKLVLIKSCSHVSSVFIFGTTDNHKRHV